MQGQNPSANQPSSPKARNVAAAVTIAVIAVAVIVLVALYLQNNAKPASTPVVNFVVDGNLTINPGSYVYYNFTVYPGPQGATIKPTVQGTFNVTDETENTINVYISDSANFADWQNGLSSDKYYDSGPANAGNVTATLSSPGTYYLVYDNTHSETSKTVNTQVAYAHW